ncbi:MAG: hypothetical protein HLUCCA11_11635 [Phormidesmis priestleyi Ana]|uniref:Uncharacterized protein n=1 Tax=Phormidesmis priestleyi Ana TaxID=1666911 RepID=A0A0P8C1M7_9CYAN|nr:MAG: hypothetical protein HLUCCA11_11635 [Phormidesmis priestleyi Ana]
MAILNRFMKLLEWLETTRDFFYFLGQPIGISATTALFLYFSIQLWGCDSLLAVTLSCVGALK